MEEIQKAFDAIADQYDSQRRHVIPEFDAFYASAVWAAEWNGTAPRILDVGAGTGLLGARILARYPGGMLTLVDISDSMLDVARGRFGGQGNVRCFVQDYRAGLPCGPYDIVCSALSIHHLERNEKRLLYERIFTALERRGVFVNAEQVEGETPWQHARNMEYWNDFVLSGPLPREEIAAMYGRRERLDHMETLSAQIRWLRDAGFEDIDVVYKNRSFAVFMGRKG